MRSIQLSISLLFVLALTRLAHAQCTNTNVPNDCFANAQLISGQWGSVLGTNIGASAEFGEPAHAGFTSSNSIWYVWTAPEDGEVTFDTLGSLDNLGVNLDTVLAVYTGSSLGNLLQVAANDDYYPFTHGVITSQSSPLFSLAGIVPFNR